MPSTGIRSVPAVYRVRRRGSSATGFGGLEKSVMRSRAEKRLRTSRAGAASFALHRAYRIPAPYLFSRTTFTLSALPDQEFPSLRTQAGASTEGSGNQACAPASGFSISMREVTSKLRQPGVDADSALCCVKAARGQATAVEIATPVARKLRRFIGILPTGAGQCPGGRLCASGFTPCVFGQLRIDPRQSFHTVQENAHERAVELFLARVARLPQCRRVDFDDGQRRDRDHGAGAFSPVFEVGNLPETVAVAQNRKRPACARYSCSTLGDQEKAIAGLAFPDHRFTGSEPAKRRNAHHFPDVEMRKFPEERHGLDGAEFLGVREIRRHQGCAVLPGICASRRDRKS